MNRLMRFSWPWMLAMVLMPVFAWAQVMEATPTPEELAKAADALGQAISSKQGWMATAGAVLGLLIKLLKTPLGGNLLSGTSSAFRFWIPFGVGLLAGLVDKVLSGGTWPQAILSMLLIALPAITIRRAGEVHGIAEGPK